MIYYKQNYPKFLRKLDYGVRMAMKPPIVVYQMGKVGSTSVWRSLRKVYSGVAIFSHHLYEDHPNWQLEWLNRSYLSKGKKVKVISMTREPFARNLSAFFENFKSYVGVSYEESNHTVEELSTFFIDNYKHNLPLEWFDHNFAKNFDFDLYATPFSDEGYQTYQHGPLEFLIMRCELDDSIKEKEICKFTGLDALTIEPDNVGAEKAYKQTYYDFKKSIKLPQEYIDRLCGSKYFKHFYGQLFVEEVRQKWMSRLA